MITKPENATRPADDAPKGTGPTERQEKEAWLSDDHGPGALTLRDKADLQLIVPSFRKEETENFVKDLKPLRPEDIQRTEVPTGIVVPTEFYKKYGKDLKEQLLKSGDYDELEGGELILKKAKPPLTVGIKKGGAKAA